MVDLKTYYEQYFPSNSWVKWVSHSASETETFTNREFAFTILRSDNKEAYLRHHSFANLNLFKNILRSLTPLRFEVGAVYSLKPINPKPQTEKYFAKFKELVFDIDLSDYDSFRTCCQGKQVCAKCWQFIEVAMKVMAQIFDEDFGYKHVLWVFSGRRGVHAWVCDRRACLLDDMQRVNLVEYMNVLKYEKQKIVINRPFHPMVKRSFDTLKQYFRTVVLINQNPWETDYQYLITKLQPADPVLADALQKEWETTPKSSSDKWDDIDKFALDQRTTEKAQSILETKQNIIFEFLYPKLDLHVSTSRQHLLKSPFCVHPQTQQISVPFDPATKFDPSKAPSLTNLESLEPYVLVFNKFVNNMIMMDNTQ